MAIDRKEFIKQTWIGWITGILSPLLGFYIFVRFYFDRQPLLDVLQMFIERNVLTHAISLSVIINLVFFFGFLKTNRDAAARGVLGATFLYVFVVLFLKLI